MAVASRDREIARIQRVIERLHSSRLQMMLIVALTAAVGFLASFGLLHTGIDSLWLRYPLAVAVAYLGFLVFLWCWLRLKKDYFLDTLDIPTSGPGSAPTYDIGWKTGGGQFGGGGASGSYDEAPGVTQFAADINPGSSEGGSNVSDVAAGVFDLEELIVVLLAITALIGTALAAVWIVWAAPAVFAELLLDAALAAGLYRRLRSVTGDYWLRTAIRRTVWPFVGVAVLFSLAGIAMQAYAPGAKSIGHVMRYNAGQIKD